MKFSGLVRRSLEHYRRTHLGVLAGALIATATLVGALVVGDSVRFSLMRAALERVGAVHAALDSGDRFFRDRLSNEAGVGGAPAVTVSGVASSADGTRRLHDVQVLGVDDRFFELAPKATSRKPPEPGTASINRVTADRLSLQVGDDVVVRVELPSALPRDMALAPGDVSVALRLRIADVLASEDFAGFSLRGGSGQRANVFVELAWLQAELNLTGRANLLLSADSDVDRLNEALGAAWELADAQLELVDLAEGRRELQTQRIFFDEPILDALETLNNVALDGVFTYFVNGLRLGERATPYSMVSALGPLNELARSDASAETEWVEGLGEEELLLGDWAAVDLAAEVGDTVAIDYYVIDASRKLVERSESFRVGRVVPLEGVGRDASLMPDFPGLADSENCRDWEPGTPVDLDRIRDKDEVYWDEYGGTPKAFLSLPAGRRLWTSRFGALTAVRFASRNESALLAGLKSGLTPAEVGLFFRDVRTPALAAGNSATDFGGLFIGLSFFLIVSALLLASQLFAFGVEQRSREVGLYSALGLNRRFAQRLFLSEALLLSAVGAALGTLVGLGYTKLVLLALSTVWSDAVTSARIDFHAEPTTLALGFALSVAASVGTAWLVLRKTLANSASRLLHSAAGTEFVRPAGRWSRAVAALCFFLALAIVIVVSRAAGDSMPGPIAGAAFFGAGTLVLVGALILCRAHLRRPPEREVTGAPLARNLAALGRQNCRRRPSRSMATIALMAIGTFLVVAVGAHRLGPTRGTDRRASGTGGFALFGRSSLPVVHDLNDPLGRAALGLDEEDVAGVEVVPMRVLPGDDASCLNLARPQAPPLFGVQSAELSSRNAFSFAASAVATDDPWSLLAQDLEDGSVPAIGDVTSLTWQLHLGVGDTLDYTDERGRPFRVRIVGAVADSILQGALLIEEAQFEELFPTRGGHRRFLVDAGQERVEEVTQVLSRALRDVGLALEPTGDRLDAFHAVQNSYLSIFQALGGLGLLLGTVGLGMVLLRNTLERRAELALVSALGFPPGRARWWILSEYGYLLVLGLGTGTLAALVAVVPAMRAAGSDLSLASVWVLCAALGLSGAFWLILAARIAVRRPVLGALSEE